MPQKQSIFTILTLFSLVLLSACGGSGDTNSASEPATNNATDTTAPVITLNGDTATSQWLEMTYIEQGATAKDDQDGTVEVVITGRVDTDNAGLYTITYTAKDSTNNTATMQRTVEVLPLRPFKATWSIHKECGAGSGTLLISTAKNGHSYNYNIDWGDGHLDSSISTNIAHDYSHSEQQATDFIVKISGDFPQIAFESLFSENQQGKTEGCKLTRIEQWGDIKWQSMENAFSNVPNLAITAMDAPDLSQADSLAYMFKNTTLTFSNNDLNTWNVANIRNMQGMFRATNFNADISQWDVSNVINMNAMFYMATEFNRDISQWDVSRVTDMGSMFANAYAFAQNLSLWDVSNVTNMARMFFVNVAQTSLRSEFNSDLGQWDVSKVTNMEEMFHGSHFNTDISRWNVSSVTLMNGMFAYAPLFNADISQWDVSNVTNMEYMFYGANFFDGKVAQWDIANVTRMQKMFSLLSTDAYDAILTHWSLLAVQQGVFFEAGNSFYSPSSQAAKDVLVNTFGWRIEDAGVKAK